MRRSYAISCDRFNHKLLPKCLVHNQPKQNIKMSVHLSSVVDLKNVCTMYNVYALKVIMSLIFFHSVRSWNFSLTATKTD